MVELKVYINGQIVPRSEAKVSVWDSGFQSGDSVYEGIRVYDGKALQLKEHIRRLYDSAHAIGIKVDMPTSDAAQAVLDTLKANNLYDGAHVRITLTRGIKPITGMDPELAREAKPLLVIIAEPKEPSFPKTGITLVTSSVRRMSPECLDPKIHSCNQLGQILAKFEANNAGASEALMLDVHGFVAETNSANFFIVRDDVIRTPRRNSCLNGLTRAWVIRNAPQHCEGAFEDDISLTDVYTADEAFICGTICEIVPVVQVDGRTIGSGRPGEVTQAIAAAYDRYAHSSGVPLA